MKKTIVIVTGMSGAGKTQVLNTLQDNGFYCIDNLPLLLFKKFMELLDTPSSELGSFIALGLDLREANLDEKFPELIEILKKYSHSTKIIFVDCSEEVLIKRFTETRRPHPLSLKGNVIEGIKVERERLVSIKEQSDVVIDTSNFNIHDLRREIVSLIESLSLEVKLVINLISFGFSKGIPPESSLVFDVRFLPNPYFVSSLKDLSGKDEEVKKYVLESLEGREYFEKVKDFIEYLLPKYQKEGRAYLTISIGCTGGKHRSVAIAEEMYSYLKKNSKYIVRLSHRDIKE